MTPIQQQRFDRCIEFLRPIAQKAADEASEVYWIAARNADPDQGPSYCRACADALVDKLNAEHPDHEYLRDGGWGYEADTQEICEQCGIHLSCTLTEHGIEQELDHWSRYRIDLKGKHASVRAYFLLNTLECAYMGNADDAPWLHGYKLDRAKAIQREVHRLTRRVDGIRSRAACARGEGERS